MLDALSDFCLLLANQFVRGVKAQKDNKELIFLDNAKADVLGNSKQVTSRRKKPMFWDPEFAAYASHLAEFFIKIKEHHSFLAAYELSKLKDVVPPCRSKEFEGYLFEEEITKEELQRVRNKQKQDSYYRRRRRQ
jgi:hypothetical protein